MALTRLNGINAITGTIPQGNIANASLGAVTALPAGVGGKVLQVVSATDTTERATTSSTFVTISNTLSVNITPSSTSSKIFVVLSTSLYSANAAKATYVTIFRDSTNLGNANGLIRLYNASNAMGIGGTCAVLDSPSSTSEITYQAYIRGDSGSTQASINANTSGFITAFEIGA
jgi:hypothetical protein